MKSPNTPLRLTTMAVLSAFLLLLVLGGTPPQTVHAAVFLVTNTADSGPGSLRQAVVEADLNPGADVINFNIPGCGGVCTIQLNSTITLVDPDGVTIDGYSQPGAVEATGFSQATILIELDGSSTSGIAAIIAGSNNIIKGLAINRFNVGIAIGGTLATGNQIRGCYLGTDASGTVDLGNTNYGIQLSNSTSGNVIGGASPADRNLISGNDLDGISIDSSSTGNTVSGNYIGTTADGLSALGNTNAGIKIHLGAHANTIGGSSPGAGNLISGNDVDGIVITGGAGDPHDNLVQGNWIGLDVNGTLALPNGQNGVQILNSAYNNMIGPDNVISGNAGSGVDIWTPGTNGNYVEGNLVGTDWTGTAALPNGALNGAIYIHNAAQGNVVGGSTADQRNVIAGNTGQGVRISGAGTDLNVVSGNYIGLDITGMASLPNGSNGVAATNGAAYNTIGGSTAGAGNVIADTYSAVTIEVGANNNTVSGNLLGTDATGTVGMGVGTGVSITSAAHDNTIGGTTIAERNVISGNGGRGVIINGADTDNNQVLGNYIGVDITGLAALPNGTSSGIRIENGAQSNTIGPGNIIAYHATEGIYIYGADTDLNVVTQNSIFANTNWNISVATDGANNGIVAPTVSTVTLSPLAVSGTTSPPCVGCTVEVFTSLVSFPRAGRSYLGSGVTDGSGNWTVNTPGLHGPYITATLTDAAKGTSNFSNAIFTTIEALYLPLIMR